MADGRARPSVCGAEEPALPFPIFLQGIVEHGFGRGSKQLNCATANLPTSALDATPPDHRLTDTGVYFGWAQVRVHNDATYKAEDSAVHPMVMSVGWNPQFENPTQSVEVHILHHFAQDFYGREMRVCVLGYIRPERKYESLGTLHIFDADALMKDIETDKQVGQRSLARPAYEALRHAPAFAIA
ncbi:riboflavin kinase [Malassezia equina]|uniref:Riboflavin kinase n=1 Tax=Malassezia equina TaxID=1381935 RepID=A0AAF0EFH5_9BASI|nr:riboflavin kinase [Malassezia equina]